MRATPAARRLARECGVTLADVAAATYEEVVSEAHVREYADNRDGQTPAAATESKT